MKRRKIVVSTLELFVRSYQKNDRTIWLGLQPAQVAVWRMKTAYKTRSAARWFLVFLPDISYVVMEKRSNSNKVDLLNIGSTWK